MQNKIPPLTPSRAGQRAFTLVELMIALAIGLLLLSALLAVFLNVSRSNREMQRTNILIENGRFAVQLLQNDLVHAGYWGELDYMSEDAPTFATPTAEPDPCNPNWGNTTYSDNVLGIPVDGYPDGTALAACGVSNVLANSEVLVVRHANTCLYGDANCDDGADTGPHIQVSTCNTDVAPLDARYVMASGPTDPAFTLRQKTCAAAPTAPLRKIVTNIYYLADSNGQPSLMRISMQNGAFTAPQPFIEGIEHFHVEYGIDENGQNGLPISATNPGDGSADRFITTADLASAPGGACTSAGTRCFLLANAVAVKIHVLARNLESSAGYTDAKSYQLGSTAVAAANDGFKRHVFSSTIRLVNPSSRRETP